MKKNQGDKTDADAYKVGTGGKITTSTQKNIETGTESSFSTDMNILRRLSQCHIK